MIKLNSLLNWKKAGFDVNKILACMETPSQECEVEWDGQTGIFHDENLEELFRDVNFSFLTTGEEEIDMEKAKTEEIQSSIIITDNDIAVEFTVGFFPNRFDSDIPETIIDFNTGKIVEKVA